MVLVQDNIIVSEKYNYRRSSVIVQRGSMRIIHNKTIYLAECFAALLYDRKFTKATE